MLTASLLCALALAFACLPVETAFAATWDCDVLEDGSVIITKFYKSTEELEIPSVLSGHPVVGIGDGAISGKSTLRKLTIPEGVTSIGSDAFADCPDLTLTVARGSFAEWYCAENGLEYRPG